MATLYLSYFQNLGMIGLVGPDEPRYAWIARDMSESGDWVTPRLYGQPWFEKPVLYYWGAALSFKLFGISEVTARVPSAIAALLATLAMAWLAWRIYSVEVARWLLLLLPTSVGMIGFSHAAATDMPFAGMLTIAMVFATVVLGLAPSNNNSASRYSTTFAMIGLGFFLGLAVLAKGPAAIILSGGAILSWALVTKRWRDAFRCLHPIAITSFSLAALPWYIVCARRNPDFFRIFIIEHNFKRYLTPEFQHVQPFWFYTAILLVAFLPWTALLLWSTFTGIRSILQRHVSNAWTMFLVSWALFGLVFFSISRSKLPGYILPSIPALALLLVKEFVLPEPRIAKVLRWLLVGFAIFLVLVSIPVGAMIGAYRVNPTEQRFIVIVPLLLAAANYLLSLKLGRSPVASALAPISMLALLLLSPQFLTVVFPADPSGRSIARELQEERVPIDRIFTGHMPRGQHFSLNFYLRKEVPEWNPQEPREGYLLLRRRHCSEIVKSPWICTGDAKYLPSSGYFVFRVEREPLVSGLGSDLDALRGDDNLRSSRDWQPR